MIKEKKQIVIGDVKIGNGAPVSVQSMVNTKTDDIKSTLKQIKELKECGCEIVRLAVLNKDCAKAIKEIKKKLNTSRYNIFDFFNKNKVFI